MIKNIEMWECNKSGKNSTNVEKLVNNEKLALIIRMPSRLLYRVNLSILSVSHLLNATNSLRNAI